VVAVKNKLGQDPGDPTFHRECPKGINIISRRWNLRGNSHPASIPADPEGVESAAVEPLRGSLTRVLCAIRRFHPATAGLMILGPFGTHLCHTAFSVVGHFESAKLLAIALNGMGLEPRSSPEWTAGGKIRRRRRITNMNV